MQYGVFPLSVICHGWIITMSMIPFLMFDSQNFQAPPFCPVFGLADKKAQVFPHLLPAGHSNHASPSPQVGILISAPLSNHKKSQASLPPF